jgi:hypothetical protein
LLEADVGKVIKAKSVGEARYRLIVKDATGRKINGTSSPRDLDGTRRMAVSVLRMDRRAASVEILPIDPAVKFERVVVTLDSEEAHDA